MRKIIIGAAELHRVEEMTEKMPIAAFTEDKRLLSECEHWLKPHLINDDGTWNLVYQSWILAVDGKVIVIDPCVGNGRSFPEFPKFDGLETPYIERFSGCGITPEEVDYVFCTHLHADHCGWNTRLRDGKYLPTFPNARYVIVGREFRRWDVRRTDHVPVKFNAGVFENSVLPVVEAGLMDIVEDNFKLSASLSVEPAYGHTAGHSILNLCTENSQACFTGDAFHHPLELVYPELDLGASENLANTVLTRQRLRERFLQEDTIIIPAHMPAPHMGRLRQSGHRTFFEAIDSDVV